MPSHDRQRKSDSALGFSLEPEVPAPDLPGQVIVRRDEEDLHSALAADLLVHAHNCVRQFGDFHLALSGGSTPQPFYMRLMMDPAYRSLPWKKTHIWVVDERRVDPDDDRFNYKHIREILVEHADVPPDQAHPIDALADDADARYESELKEVLAWRERGHDRLDFVLLGMGDDCHTASLFPRSGALSEHSRLVAINAGEEVTPPERVTMTYPLLNSARFAAVLVTGEKKRGAIARVASRVESPRECPIAGINPIGGVLRWYLDEDACPRD